MGQDTDVELYMYASGRWAVDERLALVYAGRDEQTVPRVSRLLVTVRLCITAGCRGKDQMILSS